MLTSRSEKLLRDLLLLDAGTCIAMGLLLTAGAAFLANLTAIPATLLFYVGVILFPVAGFMILTAIRALGSTTAVRLIVAGNVLWVVASMGLMLGGWISPNALGYAFIGIQALVVAVVAGLEHVAWRRMTQVPGSLRASTQSSIIAVLAVAMLTLGWQVAEAQERANIKAGFTDVKPWCAGGLPRGS